MKAIKCVAVGSNYVGKTTLMMTYNTKTFPKYTSAVCDNISTKVSCSGKLLSLELWDTAEVDGYDRLRPLSYPGTNVFMICFSLVNRGSFDSVLSKWKPEVEHHCPGALVVLVGTKLDLRENPKAVIRTEIIEYQEALELAQQIGAANYFETSALTYKGINALFQETIFAVIANNSTITQQESKRACQVM